MKKMFLTSSVNFVAKDIAKYFGVTKNLKLLFITTAVEVEEGDLQWLKDDREALVNVGFNVSDYTITGKNKIEIRNDLEKTDIIYFSGGNTFYLLQQIQKSNCVDIIYEVVNKGKIFIGSSAGSVIAGPDIYPVYMVDEVKKAPNLVNYKGLDLVNFVIFPHWGSEYFKSEYVNEKTIKYAYTENDSLVLLNNYQFIIVEDDTYKIINW